MSLPGADAGSHAQLGIQLMKSRTFIGEFVERRNILPELMAVESWDSGSESIVYDSDIYDAESKTWVREVDPPKLPKPSRLQAHAAFMDILTVSENKMTGYVSVSIQHRSPDLAKQWVIWLVEDVNAAVKAQVVSEAEKSIEYLKQQVANTSLADLQAMFFELIQSQTETVMLAEVRPEFVFKTIDPVVRPEQPSSPDRPYILALGTFFGFLLGCLITLLCSDRIKS